MHPRVDQLTRDLGLTRHPEGGSFREIFRSPQAVRPADGRPERSGLTVIYFLLAAGEESRWHRVASDECWTWLEGDPLDLFEADQPGMEADRYVLGTISAERVPVHVVPAGRWQAARTAGAYTLVSCSVGPGFDFADFELAEEVPLPKVERLRT